MATVFEEKMARGRHRKSKSASGIEGIRQVQKPKVAARLSSDSYSHNDGRNRDDMFMLESGQSSLVQVTGIPMKKLLAEEMSKEVESKRRSPSVIARLMGLERMPSPHRVHRLQKRFSDCRQQKYASINPPKNNQLHEGESSRRSSIDQQEFKDVYEDLKATYISNRRCSSRWSASSILTKPDMELIQQKFIDAKHLSTDKKLQNSNELDDTLEMPDSNKDSLLKCLQQPDSSFVKHFHDLHDNSHSSVSSDIEVSKPSNSEKYESKAQAWRSKRDTSNRQYITSHLKREDGLLLEPHNHHRARISCQSSGIRLEEKNEGKILPTRVVILKPNLGKMQNAGALGPLPHLSHGYQSSFKKNKEFPSVGGAETVSRTRKDSHNVRISKSISLEAREKAREITMRMRNGCDETEALNIKSIGLRGYVGDESSNDANESDSESESEVFKLPSRKSFDDSNFCRHPASHFAESSVNKEAKKRLSERWKVTHKYQNLEMVSKGRTLGEMLALTESETNPLHLNAKTSLGNPSNPLGGNSGTGLWDDPLGISSRDGWKDETSRNLSRSRSLPPSTGGRSHRSTHHDGLSEKKILIHRGPVHCGRSKDVKGNLSHKEDNLSKGSKSVSKKLHPCQHIFRHERNSSPDSNFEMQMEANTKGLFDQKSSFPMAAEDSICRSPMFDVMMIAEPESPTSTSKSSELLSKQSSSSVDVENSAALDQENYTIQELPKEPPKQSPSLQCPGAESDPSVSLKEADLPSFQCLGAEPDPSESSKEPDHPSPVSVLEVPFAEDTSSSESFERVSAELNELRLQLQLLRMESDTFTEASTLVPIEEKIPQPSPHVSEANPVSGAEGWEISYAVDVLTSSDLGVSDFNMFRTTWHSPGCPLDPNLFDNLEKKHGDEASGLRPERRFLFDRINSALLEMFDEHVDLCPWVTPKLGGLNLKTKDIARGVLERLMKQDSTNGEISDRVVDRELQWTGFKAEIEALGNEIEKLLTDDLITEVACD